MSKDSQTTKKKLTKKQEKRLKLLALSCGLKMEKRK